MGAGERGKKREKERHREGERKKRNWQREKERLPKGFFLILWANL